MSEPVLGDLRESAGFVEVFAPRGWVRVAPIPPGATAAQMMFLVSAPADMTAEEMAPHLERLAPSSPPQR